MNTQEQLTQFISNYMNLRKHQNEYFQFRDKNKLKECKLLELRLDEVAQRLMIDYDMNISISPEQPKLF